MLTLTTDGHKALHSLSATAELLVYNSYTNCKSYFFLLFIAEIDTKRLSYLCESVQEELKLESSYKKV